MMKLLDMLDDLDDIQTVHSNAEISNDILEQLN
jgi:transcriptional/translational regulatory protein YebC/TACO1